MTELNQQVFAGGDGFLRFIREFVEIHGRSQIW
jgi:hypothetical protein